MILRCVQFGVLWLLCAAWPTPAEQVVISKIMCRPRSAKPAYVELFNNTSNPFDIANWRLTGGVQYEFPDFSPDEPVASFLRPFERMVLSAADPATTRAAYAVPSSVRVLGPWNGKLSKQGERITLKDKNGVTVCSLKYANGGLWPVAAEGKGHALVLIDPNRKVDDWRNWTVSLRPDTAPGTAPVPNTISPAPSPEIEGNLGETLVDYSAVWRYDDSPQDLGTQWREPGFNDQAWRSGPGLLGYDTKPLPDPGLRTRIRMGRQITYYFRLQFVYAGNAKPGDRLILDQIIDDGAVYHLNGKELARSRIPSGPINYLTLASSTVPTAAEETSLFAFDPGLLRKGANVLAAEVHQCKSTSSDVVFGMRLRLAPPAKPGLVINEVFSDEREGFVEFCNTAPEPANLNGCFLSDNARNLRQHRFAINLLVPSSGLAAVSLLECGITNASPLTVYLTAPDGETVLNAVTANFAEDGRSLGRTPDGGGAWFRFPEPTRGQPNPARAAAIPTRVAEVPPKEGSGVVINEIMYDPPYGAEGTEFIELFNRGAAPVDLSGWRFSEGISFVFPRGASIPAEGYLVVAANAARLKSIYGDLPVLGDYQGRLRHSGALLRLEDANGKRVDEIDYKAGGDWPALAHGGGSSMELIHPWMDRSRGSAWRDSDETRKGAWQTYGCTNTYLEMNPFGRPTDYRELHFHLVGHGHVALRNIGLWKNGKNYLDNPTRMSTDGSSAHGWLAQGTHWRTFLTNGELHIVSEGHGDNRADRVEIDCVGIQPGEAYELRFEGRWISGCPRLVAQTWDHSIADSFLLTVPAKLGTPGGPNSVSLRPPFFAQQAAPQVDDLLHSPPVPRSTNSVKVTARVTCAAPLALVQLFHRADSTDGDAPWASKPMFDDGIHGGDEVAGDGIYTAELTEYMTNQLVAQFYVRAVAANRETATLPRRGAEWPAMFVVDDRKIQRDSRVDRFIVSAYDLGSMADGNTAKYGFHHPLLSNHRYNMTFISNEENVFYGGDIRVSGSPWTRGFDLSKGKWELPEDRPFRGRTKFYFDNDSNYHNRVCRYLLYQMGHVTSEAEWVRVIINSSGAYLKEDTEPVTGEFLERNFKNGKEGELYRIDDEWWFTDDWQHENRDADWGYKGTDDRSRYRTEWQKRSREVEDDFTALIALFKTYTVNRYTQDEIERVLDPHAILQMAAVRGYINDWDSFTMFRGKNGFFYRRPNDGRFQFLQWDSDLAFRDQPYPFYSDRVGRWLERPYNKRLFNCYLQRLTEVATSPRTAAWFDLETAARPTRSVRASFYQSFFKRRNLFATGMMGLNQFVPFALVPDFGLTKTTTNTVFTLSGTAPYAVCQVVLDHDPKLRPTWSNERTWTFSNLPLQPGTNTFVARGLDLVGKPLHQASTTVIRKD